MLIDFELRELSAIASAFKYKVIEDDGCNDPEEMQQAIEIVEKIAKATDQADSESLTMAFLSAAAEGYLEDMKWTLELYKEFVEKGLV